MGRIFPGGPVVVVRGGFFQCLHFGSLDCTLAFAPAGKIVSSFCQCFSGQRFHVYILQHHSFPRGACGGGDGFGPKDRCGAHGRSVGIGTRSAHRHLNPGGIFVPLPERMGQAILIFVVVIGFFASIMFYLAHKQPQVKEGTSSLMGKVGRFVSRWSAHLEVLRDMRIFSFGLLLAFLMMFFQTLGIWAVQKSLGFDLPFWAPILVMGALNLATVLPITPGSFGIYEGTAFLAYQFCGLAPESALGLALLQHLCFLAPMVGTGYLVLLFLSWAKKQDLSEKKWAPDET